MSSKPIPARCPSCGDRLRATRLECCACDTELSGSFEICPVCSLEGETRRVFDLFLKARGNMKQVQRELGVSYPTARLRVEEMFRRYEGRPEPEEPTRVLERLKAGEIDVAEAERLLRGGDDA